jgi:hypothetical protein
MSTQIVEHVEEFTDRLGLRQCVDLTSSVYRLAATVDEIRAVPEEIH